MSRNAPNEAMEAETRAVDAFLAGLLRGEVPPSRPTHMDLVLERVFYHGISALLEARSEEVKSLAREVHSQIRQQAVAETMWDLQHRKVLAPVLKDLQEAKVEVVVLKGTALAYSVYGSPAERPRGDTDILVQESHLTATRAVLKRHGFRLVSERDADPKPQELWSLDQEGPGAHDIDLHWNLLSSWALSSLFDTKTVLKNAVDLPRLGPGARMPAPETALLHACIHRAQHFSGTYFVGGEVTYAADRLIWFVDMDLLCRHLTPSQWQSFLEDAIRTGTAAIAHEALEQCQSRLHTPVPGQILKQLRETGGDTLAKRYLIKGSYLRRLWSNVRSLPKGRSRLGLLREILFPAEKAMRQAYPERANQSLVRLHLHRYRERVRRFARERKQRPKSS